MTIPRSKKRRPHGNAWFGYLRDQVARDEQKRGPVPDLDAAQILAWADAYHARTGKWPTCHSGRIPRPSGETWLAVEAALCWGRRGLPGNSTLTQFLARNRGKRHRLRPSRLSEKQILGWADAFHQRFGQWPRSKSGPISKMPELNWSIVDKALRHGRCGLPGGTSLARLLAAKRGVPNHLAPPRWTQRQILTWADAFHEATGSWPNCRSGPIAGAGGASWYAVDTALRTGGHGLGGGSSLVHLLVTERGIWSRGYRPKLRVSQILAWADACHERTGRWPNYHVGAIPEAPGETWRAVHQALFEGLRGLPGGSSLAQLLAQKRSVRNIQNLPSLTSRLVLRWARAHHRRTGAWPTRGSGSVLDAPGEAWANVFQAFDKGLRGLPGGTSLHRLLKRQAHGAA